MKALWHCKRCGHIWANRKDQKPIICPKCKSAYWDKERQLNIEDKNQKRR